MNKKTMSKKELIAEFNKFREINGLRLYEMSKETGLSIAHISNFLNGKIKYIKNPTKRRKFYEYMKMYIQVEDSIEIEETNIMNIDEIDDIIKLMHERLDAMNKCLIRLEFIMNNKIS